MIIPLVLIMKAIHVVITIPREVVIIPIITVPMIILPAPIRGIPIQEIVTTMEDSKDREKTFNQIKQK